jgi:hypothetical protein
VPMRKGYPRRRADISFVLQLGAGDASVFVGLHNTGQGFGIVAWGSIGTLSRSVDVTHWF